MRNRALAAILVAVSGAALLTACGPDAICGGDDYPVIQVGGTGRSCVAKGEDPPAGFARYPAGKEPKHVDDEWDVYWRDHTVDAKGEIKAA
jgi:hypothetical protein